MIYEIDLLNNEQVLDITTAYNRSKSSFVSGSLSNISSKKNNLMLRGARNEFLNQIYGTHIIDNEFFHSILVTKKISELYFLKYGKGMKYDYHIDNNPIAGVNAHYSMTCFLSNPEEYMGGELVLKIGNQELSYKLQSGKAIIYNTGISHKVNPVISGERKVFVCWIESAVKDSFIRNTLIDFGMITQAMANDKSNYTEDLEQIRINIMREYGDL